MLSVVFFLILYAVIGIAAIPLAMRLVPPNNYFGLRTPRTLDSSSHWYHVHAVGGQLLLVSSSEAYQVAPAVPTPEDGRPPLPASWTSIVPGASATPRTGATIVVVQWPSYRVRSSSP